MKTITGRNITQAVSATGSQGLERRNLLSLRQSRHSRRGVYGDKNTSVALALHNLTSPDAEHGAVRTTTVETPRLGSSLASQPPPLIVQGLVVMLRNSCRFPAAIT